MISLKIFRKWLIILVITVISIIAAGIIILVIIGSAVVDIVDNSPRTFNPDDLMKSEIHRMNQVVSHDMGLDTPIAIEVTQTTMVIDQRAPRACFGGDCIKDRDPGKYIFTVFMEITNLGDEKYYDSPYQFKILDSHGKSYSPAGRQFTFTVDEISKGETLSTKIIYDVDPPASDYVLHITPYPLSGGEETKIFLDDISKLRPSLCEGSADCFAGFITKIIDGDTLDIANVEANNEIVRIRLALVDTPEKGENQYENAKEFVAGFCHVDSYVIFDEDDGQTAGSFGRKIGKLYCDEVLLNDKLLDRGLAQIDTKFCEVSEYAKDAWAQQNGCG